jgi:hypothetical protein
VNFVYEATGVYEFQALDAALVSPRAEIPPFIDPIVGATVAGWIGGAQLVATGAFPGPDDSGGLFGGGISLSGSASISSPLGSLSLSGFLGVFP